VRDKVVTHREEETPSFNDFKEEALIEGGGRRDLWIDAILNMLL